MYRVLILDDDAQFAESLAQCLAGNTNFPCEVVAVTTSGAAHTAVQEANQPFDIFLIDQRLGNDSDGITALQELLHLSPESGSIIFTAADDLEAGERAYQAGAFRYLHKPFNPQELILVLRSLVEWNRTRSERDGLRVLTQIAEAAQHALTLSELGDIIVRGACQLGFDRARLWLLDAEHTELRDLSAGGDHGNINLATVRFPVVESPYALATLKSRTPLVFTDLEYGSSFLHRHFGDQGYDAPRGQWACLPLWYGDRCLGILGLDNHLRTRSISTAQLAELELLSQQVASALYRVQLHEQEQRKSRELEVLAEIGRLTANRAATIDLDMLLRKVRELVGRLMDVNNFQLVLYNPIFNENSFRLHVEQGIEQERHHRSAMQGLIGYVVRKQKPLLLPDGSEEFRHKKRIKRIGPPSRCWLGVPLLLDVQAIGAMSVQSYERAFAYTAEDQRLLVAVADQVTGAIQTARLHEEATKNNNQLRVLQQASAELLTLAEQNLEWFWHTTLTVITANYGLGFNRAMLFLLAAGDTQLQGVMGIGQNSIKQAKRHWDADFNAKLSFNDYLIQLRNHGFPRTQVDDLVRTFTLPLPDEHTVFGQVLRDKQVIFVSKEDAAKQLPAAFIECFRITEYAVLPLLVREKPLGLMVVDSIHLRRSLKGMPLAPLETLLTQVALVYESQRQRKANDLLVEAQLEVLAQVVSQPLEETLHKICRAAQSITGADCVLIYPLTPTSTVTAPQYDLTHMVEVGLQQEICPREHPSANGVTARVLNKGTLIVDDVKDEDWQNDRAITNSFLAREKIQAFVAMPISNNPSGNALGVLYLNYRTPQRFTEQDLRRAQSFASLAEGAIRAWRAEEATRNGREAAELLSTLRGHELRVLSRVLSIALQPVSREKIMIELLSAARDLLQRDTEEIGLVLREWQVTQDLAAEPHEVRSLYRLSADGVLQQDNRRTDFYTGITGQAFRENEDKIVRDVTKPPWDQIFRPRATNNATTRSEMDVLIRLDRETLGLFNIESPKIEAFSDEDHLVLRRLATVAALVLDAVRRQANLRDILDAVQAVVKPVKLQPTLEAVLEAARRVAPGVSAVTIWYKDPESGEIVPGPCFGVHQEHYMHEGMPQTDNVIAHVMQSPEPIFAEQVQAKPLLKGKFIIHEHICSAAALPLRAGDAVEKKDGAIGAMFFNYRQQHAFTQEEQTLFPILAAFVATSVRDALRIEQVRRERKRLRAAMEITEAVGTLLNLDETLRQIMLILRKLLPHAWPCVLTYRDSAKSLEFVQASMDFYPIEQRDKVSSLDIDTDKSIACRVARTALKRREPYCENKGDACSDPDYLETISATRSELCLALMHANKQLLGILVLESGEPDAFSNDDVNLVRGIGQAISIAIDRAYRIDELRFSSSVAHATALVHELTHDINREIGSIRKLVYVLRPDVDELHRPKLAQIERSASLLLSYAKATEETEKILLDDWIKQYLQEMTTLRDSNIQLYFELGCTEQCISVSPILLQRTLRHLIRNAIEAMSDPTIIERRLTIRTLPHNADKVEVQIANSGTPIDDKIRQRLFSNRVTTKKDDGGQGLLFVRWAVQAMGGTIDLVSKPDEDVTFGFTLPLVAQSTLEEEE